MHVVVLGLWHLGCVTAACLAAAGNHVIGLDSDEQVVANLLQGKPPLHEPGLEDLIAAELASGRLSFTTDAETALPGAEVLWVAFDTPVNERDEADVGFVRSQLEAILPATQPGTLVLISSQVPVGFTGALEQEWQTRQLSFAYSPENLRLGSALKSFQQPERLVVGVRELTDQQKIATLFSPFSEHIEWMSVESAEMVKHALNAFLATSVAFINEIARLCEQVGADAKEVERGLRSERRIGPRAYLSPGAAFAGGTLARDVRFLMSFGENHQVSTPLFDGVLASNEQHKSWIQDKVKQLLENVDEPVVAVLGLTYKPGTSTLRRSTSVELCTWLHERNITVQAHDPAITSVPDDLKAVLRLCESPEQALTGADLAVIATEWASYRDLQSQHFLDLMRRPQVIDQNWFLQETLSKEPRVNYLATGMDARTKETSGSTRNDNES